MLVCELAAAGAAAVGAAVGVGRRNVTFSACPLHAASLHDRSFSAKLEVNLRGSRAEGNRLLGVRRSKKFRFN